MVRRERESQGQSQSPRSSRRPRSRSPKWEHYSKFEPSDDFASHSHSTARPHRSPSQVRKSEVRDLRDKLRLNRSASTTQTNRSTDPAQKPDGLPASPQLQFGLNDDPFPTSVEATDDPFTKPDSSIVNMFTNLALEISNASSTLEDINNNSLSEVPFQPFSYDIFQTDQSTNLPMNFLLDQNQNLICLTPFSASNDLMDTMDDMLPPPPPLKQRQPLHPQKQSYPYRQRQSLKS